MFVYMIQPVVKPGCTTGLTTVLNEQSVSSTRLSNWFDNRLYRVNGVLLNFYNLSSRFQKTAVFPVHQRNRRSDKVMAVAVLFLQW